MMCTAWCGCRVYSVIRQVERRWVWPLSLVAVVRPALCVPARRLCMAVTSSQLPCRATTPITRVKAQGGEGARASAPLSAPGRR